MTKTRTASQAHQRIARPIVDTSLCCRNVDQRVYNPFYKRALQLKFNVYLGSHSLGVGTEALDPIHFARPFSFLVRLFVCFTFRSFAARRGSTGRKGRDGAHAVGRIAKTNAPIKAAKPNSIFQLLLSNYPFETHFFRFRSSSPRFRSFGIKPLAGA